MSSRSRISLHQRRLMLEFVKKNRCLLTTRFEGPQAVRKRNKLLSAMANLLNSQETGTFKTPDKWLRSWQDWKSDIKKKAAAIARHTQCNKGGPPPAVLTTLEQDLADLLASTSLPTSALEILDPLQGSSQTLNEVSNQFELAEEIIPTPMKVHIKVEASDPVVEEPDRLSPKTPLSFQSYDNETSDDEPQNKKRKLNRDASSEDKIASAIEKHADTNAEVAQQIGRLANVAMLFVKTWAQINNITIDGEE